MCLSDVSGMHRAGVRTDCNSHLRQIVSPPSLIKSDTSVVVWEQSRETILTREPPKGSSLPDENPSSETVYGLIGLHELGKGLVAKSHSVLSTAHAPGHSESLQLSLQKRNKPQVPLEVIQKVPASENQSSPGQVQMTHHEASLSPTEPDVLHCHKPSQQHKHKSQLKHISDLRSGDKGGSD